MLTVGVFEAKTHLAALLLQVGKGEQVLITKHGHPIARLIPATNVDIAERQHAIAQLKKFNKGINMKGLDWRTLRDEGRK
jgi:prevent-host-death family protein